LVKSLTILTISLLTTILITGGLSAIPYAYSSGPDTLKVKYTGPIGTDGSTTIEIYKKIDDFGNTPLDVIIITESPEEFMVVALNFAKDKLNSNTVFRILVDGIETAVYEIHTSCSKPLFIGQMVSGQNGVTLEVIDGTLNSESILPDNESEECIDNKKSEQTATIILKKAITNDNGVMIPANLTETFIPKIDGEDILFGEPIPITAKEPHTISEATNVPGYSFVLIAGDTECPSMLDEEFTVKKNKEITCTIYNDDNFVPGQGGSEGVTFGLNSLEFIVSSNIQDPVITSDPPAVGDELTAGTNSCHILNPELACIGNLFESLPELEQGAVDKKQWLIVDPVITETSILVFTLIPPFDPNELELSPGEEELDLQVHTCITAGIVESPILQEMTEPGENPIKAFRLLCSTFSPGDWIMNYGFIETDM